VAAEPQQPASGSKAAVGGPSGWGEFWDTVQAIVIAVVLALLIRQFVVETYRVEGESMQPTLQNNERLLVNKFIFRFAQPKPGEIIVFRPPIVGEQQDFVKRVIALGGESVSMQNGQVYINGQLQAEPWLPPAWRDQASMPAFTVPGGDVWVLGDHRAASEDSRIFGPVPLASIRGEAMLVWWPLNDFRLLGGG